MKSQYIKRFKETRHYNAIFVIVLLLCIGVVTAPPIQANEAAPLINFSVVTTQDGVPVPLPGVYIEAYSLTNQPVRSGSNAKHGGNIINIRYRPTGGNGMTHFNTLTPSRIDETPIDIDGDGTPDRFNIPGGPSLIARTGANDKSINLAMINGKPIMMDPQWCMTGGGDFTKLYETGDRGQPHCQMLNGMNFLCWSSPFYARAVPRVDMEGEFTPVGVAHNNGEVRPLGPCTGPYTDDFGESNNYGACIDQDPLGRGFPVIRWGHGNSVANLTFYIEFGGEPVVPTEPPPSPTEPPPTPTPKETITEEVDIQWPQFQCVDAVRCEDAPELCEADVPESKQSFLLKNVGALVRTYGLSQDKPGHLVQCTRSNDAAPKDGEDEVRDSYSCTTGIPGLDSRLGLKGLPGVTGNVEIFDAFQNKLSQNWLPLELSDDAPPDQPPFTDAYEWIAPVPDNTSTTFMIVYDQNLSTEPLSGIGGLQQASLTDAGKCVLIQDPYGTVFDSHTLEPLSESTVTLYKGTGDARSIVLQSDVSSDDVVGRLRNPFTTINNGYYSFFVPDGTYELDVSRTGYRFPSDLSSMNPRYSEVYDEIYTGGPIVQQGNPEHRDIPLDPIDKEASLEYARNNPVTLLSRFEDYDPVQKVYTVQGRVSHPRTYIRLLSYTISGGVEEDQYRILSETTANTDGDFTISISQESLEENEYPGTLEMVKYNAIEESVNSPVTVALNTILPTIEGYAVDTNGMPVANADVEIYSQFSDTPVIVVEADDTGYFMVNNLISRTPHRIEVYSQGREIASINQRQLLAQSAAVMANRTLAVAENPDPEVLGVQDEAIEAIQTNRTLQIILILVAALAGVLFIISIATVIISRGTLKKIRSRMDQ